MCIFRWSIWYCSIWQWDADPYGEGETVRKFLKDSFSLRKFKEKLYAAKFVENDYIQSLYKESGESSFKEKYPQFTRDCSADVLNLVQNGENGICLQNQLEFAADSLFCEWTYVIDLNKKTFEVYKGFNQNPLSENDRFYFLTALSIKAHRISQYHAVKLIKSYSLNEVPSSDQFSNDFREEDDD